MKTVQNQAGGATVIVVAGDDLSAVPTSHREMISPAVRAAFNDPVAYFQKIAFRSQIPELTKWLTALIAEKKWTLLLHEGFMFDRSLMAAFHWNCSHAVSAMISLPRESLSQRVPTGFRHYFSLVGAVHWDDFGCAGGLLDSQDQIPLAAFSTPRPKRKGFDPSKCVVWGNSIGGDMLIYTTAGKAGFLSHESGKVQALGTIEEALSWVFEKLAANSKPEIDYS
jgi:hypothetical protein